MILSKKLWGPKTWYMLHAFSINNNLKISDKNKHKYYIFYTSLLYIIPCEICKRHYTEILNILNPIEEDNITRNYIKKWVYNTHNLVNDFLNKPKYNYSKLKDNYKQIDHVNIFYILILLIKNFDFNNMSIFTYDHLYNFFINFCYLYPNKDIKLRLKKLLNTTNFYKIQTPKKFEKWFNKDFLNSIIK